MHEFIPTCKRIILKPVEGNDLLMQLKRIYEDRLIPPEAQLSKKLKEGYETYILPGIFPDRIKFLVNEQGIVKLVYEE